MGLAANLLTGMLYLFVGGDMGGTFGLALVYAVLFSPASYVCWFRPAYKAFRDDSSFNFMIFFFVFFFQTIVSVLYSLGIGGMGSSGLILGFSTIGKGGGGQIFVGVLMVMIGIGFGLVALAEAARETVRSQFAGNNQAATGSGTGTDIEFF